MLRIEAKQDLQVDENGWCRLFIEGLPLTEPEPLELCIKRAGSSLPFLGERGWQASEAWLLFDEVTRADDALMLRVGPHHTWPLSEATTVEIRVRLLGESARPEQRSRLAWPRIVLPVANPFQDSAEEAPAPPAPPPPPPPAASLADSEESEAKPVELAAPVRTPEPPAEGRANRLWIAAALGIAILVVLAGLAAFYSGVFEADKELAQEPTQEPIQKSPPAASGRVFSEAEIRTFLSAQPSGDETLAEAEAYLAAGHPDLALLLYRNADRQGVAAASVAIGRMYDPQDFNKEASPFPAPDGDQAASYYQKAAENGDAEAQYRLAKLMLGGGTSGPSDAEQGVVWLRRAADQGHPGAKEMLATLDTTAK